MNIRLTKNEQTALRALLNLPPDTMCQLHYCDFMSIAADHKVEEPREFARKAWSLGFGDNDVVFPGETRETIFATEEAAEKKNKAETEARIKQMLEDHEYTPTPLEAVCTMLLKKIQEIHGKSSTMLNFAYMIECLTRGSDAECLTKEQLVDRITEMHIIGLDFLNLLLGRVLDIVNKEETSDVKSILITYKDQ